MKTVEEILRESGLSDEQIKAIDAKAISGLTQVVSSAQTALEAAELAKRAQADLYDKQIAPALDAWANQKSEYDTKIAAYEAALKGAKEGGFKIPDILSVGTTPPAVARATDGTFVANKNPVPGSPEFVSKFRDEAGAAIGTMLDLDWKYRSLFGQPMPDSPTTIIREATAQRLDPVAYAAKKYGFAERETKLAEEKQKKHDDAIRAETAAAKDKEWSEKIGNNPDIRQAQESAFGSVSKAVVAGTRKDPLTMTKAERHASTRQHIQQEIAANETVQ